MVSLIMKNEDKPWWDQETDNVAGSWKVPPYDNFFIGSDPTIGMTEATARKFDAFINVGDSIGVTLDLPDFSQARTYWYPLYEFGTWGYGPFFWSKKILDYHHSLGHKVYLHCRAGRHRSPMIFLQWLLSRGHRLEEAAKMTFTNKHEAKDLMNYLRQDILGGHIPGNLDEMHKRMKINPNQDFEWILMKPEPISDGFEAVSKRRPNMLGGQTG